MWRKGTILWLLFLQLAAARRREPSPTRWVSSHIRRQFKKLERRLDESDLKFEQQMAQKDSEIKLLKDSLDKLVQSSKVQDETISIFTIRLSDASDTITNQDLEILSLKNRLVQLENYYNFDLTTFASSSASNSAASANDVARLEELIENKEKSFVKTILELYSDLGRHSDQLAFPVDRSRLPRIALKSRRKSLISETDVSSSSDARILLIGGISKYEDEIHTPFETRRKSSFIRRDYVFSMDPLINSTVMTHSLPEARAYHCSVLLENRVYVLGGEGIDKKILNSMLVLTDWGWDRAKEMNLERKRLSCAVFRERIWACGGTMTYHRRKEATSSRTSAITIPHKTCESYHPQDGWREEASMRQGRQCATASVTSHGLYIIGGGDELHSEDPESVDMIETFSDNFVRGPEPLQMRQSVGSASVSVYDSIFLLGGWSQITKQYLYDVLVLYPHNKDQWKKIGVLQSKHYGFGAVFHGGLIYVLGGRDEGTSDEVFPVSIELLSAEEPLIKTSAIEISHPTGSDRSFQVKYHSVTAFIP
ncbi:Oidioi.mRNA.OKI2018_I69.chr2.g6027.t1.cds [Oikopleura dioica]|uniref:Oidioi.mRNA.OKI2018_I69.chr2.g6027.t1.cds n=1 Tax=Oikopleura dioica TaxID=34765 RepID=A0ABN7T1S3_OIKDI|nr:Oidioi.mRNA.OKI2018_I69.chr2.g6027.t1.cds [Oikopleura dioica]